MKRALLIPIVFLLMSAGAAAQTTVNPQISVIPRFVITSDDGEKLAQGKREFSQPDLQFQELELAIQAYLNPFAKADVILTIPGPDIENGKLGVEELYATVVRGLPYDMNVRIGKYRAEFGKLNTMHPHAWPFITQPLSAQRFFGESLNDLGISASFLVPTGDLYTRFTVDLLRGGSIAGTTGLVDTLGRKPYYANSARLTTFVSLDDNNDLELGVSGYTGIHDPYTRDRFWYLNGDFKFKYRASAYTSLVVQGEYLYNTRRASEKPGAVATSFIPLPQGPQTLSSSGLYLYADYQFFKQYSIGARFDWSETPYSTSDKATGIAFFAGYYPVEETLGLRLEYMNTHTETPALSQSVNSVALQVLFSLGPHKAHPF